VIRKTLMLVQNMIDVSGIETSLQLGEVLPHVFIDEHQIEQVLVNLVTNAVQAMSTGGWLVTAETRNALGGLRVRFQHDAGFPREGSDSMGPSHGKSGPVARPRGH